MGKFGVIKTEKLKFFLHTIALMETRALVLLVKKITATIIVVSILWHIIDILVENGKHSDLIKLKSNHNISLQTNLENEKKRIADMTIRYVDKLANTIEVGDLENELKFIYGSLAVTNIIDIDRMQINLKKLDEKSVCYNKADINIAFKSNYKDTALFDDILGYFTELFLTNEYYKLVNVSGGVVVLEYKNKNR